MSAKLSEKIYTLIRNDIVGGRINEQTIFTEQNLAQKYGVSKAPIKEALHLLCADGYLLAFPRKGYLIKHYTAMDIRYLSQIRRPLEKLAVCLAIDNATDEQIQSLIQYRGQSNQLTDPSQTSNAKFHMTLATISGNPYLPDTLQPIINNISRYFIAVNEDFESHGRIVRALLARNKDDAIAAIEDDLVRR